MQRRMVVALVGIASLILGVFSPLVTVPIIGSLSYMATGGGDGWFILLFALLALLLAAKSRFTATALVGCLALLLTGYTFTNMVSILGNIEHDAFGLTRGIGFSWGWGPLVLGGVLLIVTGFLPNEQPSIALRKCIRCAEMIQPDALVCRFCGQEYRIAAPSSAYSQYSPGTSQAPRDMSPLLKPLDD